MIGIYKITSPKGLIYVGQSINLTKRLKEYKSFRNCIGQIKLYRSLKKYGPENHIFEILEKCEIAELNNRERYYQDLHSAIGKNGLNLKLTKNSDKKGCYSEETRKRMSDLKTGKPATPKMLEHLRNLAFQNIGKKRSQETRDKISKGNMGNKKCLGRVTSQETRKKIGDSNRNPSEESLQRMRDSSPHAKKVFDTKTGIVYRSAKYASTKHNIKYVTLVMQLLGKRKNKTSLIYMEK